MKLIHFSLPTLLVLMLCLMSCTTQPSGNQASEASDSLSQAEQATRSLDMLETSDLLPSEISAEAAHTRVAAFQEQVSSNPTKEFANAFNLNHGDILDLFNDHDVQNTHDIFAMFGYLAETSSFDLIFSIYIPASNSYRYFNFTQPCPNFCPKFDALKGSPLPKLSDLEGVKGYWFGRANMTPSLEAAKNGGAESYLALQRANFANDIHFLVCEQDCTVGQEPAASFQPCDVEGHPCPEI
ncbi:MAG: hypothetical protein NWR72_14550 [Bacteroidia bacterium]|nr:hypothetical protein [Bacteroidia bacterium]